MRIVTRILCIAMCFAISNHHFSPTVVFLFQSFIGPIPQYYGSHGINTCRKEKRKKRLKKQRKRKCKRNMEK